VAAVGGWWPRPSRAAQWGALYLLRRRLLVNATRFFFSRAQSINRWARLGLRAVPPTHLAFPLYRVVPRGPHVGRPLFSCRIVGGQALNRCGNSMVGRAVGDDMFNGLRCGLSQAQSITDCTHTTWCMTLPCKKQAMFTLFTAIAVVPAGSGLYRSGSARSAAVPGLGAGFGSAHALARPSRPSPCLAVLLLLTKHRRAGRSAPASGACQ